MAILKDLIVSGSSRLLGKLYTNDIEIGNDLTVTGVTTTTRMIISSTNNPGTLSSTNSSTGNIPLIIGSPTSRHIAIDADEIAAKKNSTTGDSLFLNYGGGNVYLSTGYTVFASGNEFTATTYKGSHLGDTGAYFTSGYITAARITTANTNTINNADMITTSALDVKGKLHAVEYDLENIMDLGGSFVVAPTLIVPSSGSGTKTLTVSKSNDTTVVLTVKDPSITSTGIAGFAWANNYKVKVSGLINNTVLGTCDGYINSTNVSSNTISLTVTMDSATVTAIATTVSNYKLNIMLYNTDTSSATAVTKPLGIYLQHYQLTNNPIINVWNGQTTTPKVRIGYLGGITYNGSSLGTNAQNSWGLYSDNVFLEGQIVAKGGKIGGYSIGTSNLTKGTTQDASGSFWLTPEGQSATMSHLSSSAQTWAMTVGQDFGVTTSGSIYAHAGYIAGWKIENNDLVTGTWGSENSAMLCTGTTSSKEIGGSSSINGWVFTAGSKFGVTKGGALYCNDIHATGGSISGSLVSTGISASNISTGTLSADRIGANSITGAKIAANTITADKLTVGDLTNYSQLNDGTASYWGFTADTTADGHWYTVNTLTRDKFISDYFECQGGETFQVSFEISTSVKGNSSRGGTDSVYKGTAIGIYCYNDANSSVGILYSDRVTATSSATATKVNSTVGPISANARKFRIFVQTDSYGNFSGTMKLRNIRVYKASGPFITYVSATDGIKIHNASDATDYFQVNSTAIKMYRNNSQKMYLDDSKLQFTNGSTLLSQLDSTSQKFYDGSGNVVASFGSDGIKMYLKGTTTETVNINNSGATFKGTINATGGYIGSYIIGTQYLQAADGTTGMSIKDDSNTKDWAFWAGGTTKETAKFRVTHDGDLYAQSLFVNIGGRNLLKGTKDPVISSASTQYTWRVQSSGDGTGTIETITDSPIPSVSRSFRITGNTSKNRDFAQQTNEFQKNWGSQWTFSTYVRGIGGNATVLIRSWNNTDGDQAFIYTKTVGTSWEKVIVRIPIDVSWNSTASASDSLDIRFGMTGAGAIEYIAPKLEQGIVATDWSPAPEDSITSWKINANDIKNESTSNCTFSVSNDVVTVTRLNSTNVFGCYYDLPCKPNKYYSVSMRVTAGGTGFDFYFGGDYGSGSVWTGMGVAFQREANGIRRATIFKPTSSTQTYLRIYIGSRTQNSTISFRDLTVYEGDDLMMVDKSAADAATTATDYITKIDSNGIWVTPSGKKPTNTSTGAGATGTKIDGTNGVQIYNNGTKIAEYGSAISIGNTSGTNNNVLIDDEGMKIKNGPSTVLAKFTSSGAVIGKTSSAQITLNSNTMQLSDKNGNVFFKAYNASGDNGYVTNYFAGDGEEKTFTLQYTAVSSTYVVTVNGETASPTKTNSNFTFTNPPEDGAAIVAQYYAAWGAVSYDLGTRKSNTVTGSYSLIQGKDLVASGKYSLATGENCEANGESSFAGGYYCKAAGDSFAYGTLCEATGGSSVALGHHSVASGLQSYAMGNVAIAKSKGSVAIGNLTTAASRDQTVVGSANVEDTEGKYVFIVGNGKYPNYTRSNALTVDWDGGLQCGNIKCGVFQVDNCNAYAMRNITITFSKPFKTGELPCVVAMFAGGAGSYTFGNVQLSVSERDNASFTIRIYNATNTAISPYVHWIATTSGQQ